MASKICTNMHLTPIAFCLVAACSTLVVNYKTVAQITHAPPLRPLVYIEASLPRNKHSD